MRNDDPQLLREFRAEIPAPDEETRRRIYAYATSSPSKIPALGASSSRSSLALLERCARGRRRCGRAGGVGVAIAAGFGAFNGISSAQHPPTAADQLDPAVAA